MAMFNFKRLIAKYSKTRPSFKVVGEGYRDMENGGRWTEGGISYEPFDGAVLPLGEELIFDNSGYTVDDKKLYTYADISNNHKIEFKGGMYTTMNYRGYEDHDADLRVFILKRGDKQ